MDLDPVIHQATRLRIMTALQRNREASLAGLREGLALTDGNLASHLEKLEKAGYVETRRALTPRGFEARVRLTGAGGRAFQRYLETLRSLLDDLPAPLAAPEAREDANSTRG